MKVKSLLLCLALLVVLGGFWMGLARWRARRQCVTLDVREAPLADVLHRIARQTRTMIQSERSLENVRVTLHVRSMPLRDVLTRLSEQAGARWSTLYAVYNSSRALASIEAALASDGKLEPAGWVRIAPNLPPPEPTGPDEEGPVMRNDAPAGGPGQGRMLMFRRGPNGAAVVVGGANGRMEAWSPEELVMASSLTPKLGAEQTDAATPEAAARLARQVDGKWTTYFAFKKSSLGVGFSGMPPARPKPGEPIRTPNPNVRFANLTPAQRVQRARERTGIAQP